MELEYDLGLILLPLLLALDRVEDEELEACLNCLDRSWPEDTKISSDDDDDDDSVSTGIVC
jgi:hypothetical protein